MIGFDESNQIAFIFMWGWQLAMRQIRIRKPEKIHKQILTIYVIEQLGKLMIDSWWVQALVLPCSFLDGAPLFLINGMGS